MKLQTDVLVLSVAGGVLSVLTMAIAGVVYRRTHGYRLRVPHHWSLTCYRLRYRRRKEAMLTSMVEEVDVDSDSDDEEAGELSPVPSGNFSRTVSASDFAHATDVTVPSSGVNLLLQLPMELWLEVLASTAPFHHHAVSALRESCRAMRRHLQGAMFWQAMCKQAFAAWAPWMAAVGWEDCGGAAAGGTGTRQLGSSSIASRAWQNRYVACCRDQLLLRAAARQIAHTPRPPYPATAFASAGTAVPGGPPAAGPPVLAPPSAANVATTASFGVPAPAAASEAAAAAAAISAATAGAGPDEDAHQTFGHGGGSSHAGSAADVESGYDDESSDGCGGASVFTGAVGIGAYHPGGGRGSGTGVSGEGGGFLSMRGYHVAELQSLRASWGGKGPTQSQMAKGLMRRQQGRVDWLLSVVAHSSRTQRRLVPVWKRVRTDEFPEVATPAGAAHGCDGGGGSGGGGGLTSGAWPRHGGGDAARGGADASADGWLSRMHRLYALLAGGGAGPPECWVAHLAKGELLADTEASTRTTCWMLVLCSTRHAVWVDYLHMQAEQW